MRSLQVVNVIMITGKVCTQTEQAHSLQTSVNCSSYIRKAVIVTARKDWYGELNEVEVDRHTVAEDLNQIRPFP